MTRTKFFMTLTGLAVLILAVVLIGGCASEKTDPNGTIEPSETTNGFVPLAEVPEDYPFEAAVERGDVVNLHGELTNTEAYEKFKSTIEKGEPTFMRFVAYTIEGDPVLMDVNYDGTEFHLTYDVSRDAFAGGVDKVMSYTYNAYELLEDGRLRVFDAAEEQPLPQTEAPEEMILPLGM